MLPPHQPVQDVDLHCRNVWVDRDRFGSLHAAEGGRGPCAARNADLTERSTELGSAVPNDIAALVRDRGVTVIVLVFGWRRRRGEGDFGGSVGEVLLGEHIIVTPEKDPVREPRRRQARERTRRWK